MPRCHRLAGLSAFLLVGLLFSPGRPARADTSYVYLPVVLNRFGSPQPPADRNDAQAYVNYYRALAGVPAVTFDGTLNSNCLAHSQYMAESGVMSHSQSGSDAGLICAQSGDIWLGSSGGAGYWKPADSVDSWMESVGHRLWLIYPTTPTFGYGFYATPSAPFRAGAALDVLSRFNSSLVYSNWPLRYPAAGQTGVPSTRYPITLSWAYFPKAAIVVNASSLTTGGGAPLAHAANTALPAGHVGLELMPSADLPANTLINVSISGTYSGTPFNYTWAFTTGN